LTKHVILNEVKDLGPAMKVVLEPNNEIPFGLASGQASASPQPVLAGGPGNDMPMFHLFLAQ
jgi:PAB1-binding protein PBP1